MSEELSEELSEADKAFNAKYPLHIKSKSVAVQCQGISEFIDFLIGKGILFASYTGDRLFPCHISPTDLIGECYGIDPKELEKEKAAMMAEMRAADPG